MRCDLCSCAGWLHVVVLSASPFCTWISGYRTLSDTVRRCEDFLSAPVIADSRGKTLHVTSPVDPPNVTLAILRCRAAGRVGCLPPSWHTFSPETRLPHCTAIR